MFVSKHYANQLICGVALSFLAACASDPSGSNAAADQSDLSEQAQKVFSPDAPTYGKAGEYEFPATMGEAGRFSVFEPKPSGRTSAVDYEVLSEALEIMVFNTGPSLRVLARPRRLKTGTRFVRGHDSQLRLEGNKIFFSQFDEETRNSFAEYKTSLASIADRIDITTLSRNEQLAYWLNLHNVLVIDQIVTNYPIKMPARIKVKPNRELLHDAKLITIRGVPLSLSDIRRNIVYRYWSDPRVMYGFFHGDLGSPNINDEAYTGDRVSTILDRNAREFVNALRGVREGTNTIYISKHYFEARAGLFPNWPVDLVEHLNAFADDDVKLLLLSKSTFTGAQYEGRTADMVGGDPRLDIQAGPTSVRYPPQMQELAIETGEKLLELRRRGKLRSRVIIVDLPTADDLDEREPEPESDEIK